MHDILPVNERKARQNQHIQALCQRCRNENETITHLLIHCNYATTVWSVISLEVYQEVRNISDVRQWVKSWCNPDNNISFNKTLIINKIVITMWFIWKSRCELVFDNNRCNVSSLKHSIITFSNENKIQSSFRDNQNQNSNIITRGNSINTRSNRNWNPHPRGKIKINIDASVLPNSFHTGIALIIRDFTGKMVEAWTLVERTRDVAQAKAMAVLKALQWILQLQLQNVIVEGDNKEVMDSINGDSIITRWENSNIIRECQHLMKCLGNVQVCFQSRKCNQVQDLLAKYDKVNNCTRKWSSILPMSVMYRLEFEKNLVMLNFIGLL
ncbi:uncharacterized protein LOC113312143 [Papaver somniferum]|uniref:uncharacterized protein LOC113312143 n=1 Tax=Papaver somniferum TaxID=3469 RepID=UPI000E6FE597|nr:uncharacterized protein LOC113312143 [Papaver somniferum]